MLIRRHLWGLENSGRRSKWPTLQQIVRSETSSRCKLCSVLLPAQQAFCQKTRALHGPTLSCKACWGQFPADVHGQSLPSGSAVFSCVMKHLRASSARCRLQSCLVHFCPVDLELRLSQAGAGDPQQQGGGGSGAVHGAEQAGRAQPGGASRQAVPSRQVCSLHWSAGLALTACLCLLCFCLPHLCTYGLGCTFSAPCAAPHFPDSWPCYVHSQAWYRQVLHPRPISDFMP